MASRRALTGVGLALGGVALGVGVALGAVALLGGDDEAPAASTSRPLSAGAPEPPAIGMDLGPTARAASPAEAVERFLAAEQAGRYDASFALLADEDRRAFGSPGAWRAGHPDVVPPVESSTVVDAPADPGDATTAQVVTETRFASSLDAVAGLVPARATITWTTVRDGDGWAVGLEGTTQQPVLPADEVAVEAALAWARAAQACAPEGEQYEPSLRGRPALVGELCDADGTLTAGEPAPLEPEDVAPFTTVYGGDAAGWARAVPVDGPVDLRVVLAPVDDTWQVVGVLEPA